MAISMSSYLPRPPAPGSLTQGLGQIVEKEVSWKDLSLNPGSVPY